MDANLRPTEEKWMLRTSEILFGSSAYLLRTVSGSDQGLEFFLVRLLVRFHIFQIFVKMGIVVQSRGLLCRERVEIFFLKILYKSISPE